MPHKLETVHTWTCDADFEKPSPNAASIFFMGTYAAYGQSADDEIARLSGNVSDLQGQNTALNTALTAANAEIKTLKDAAAAATGGGSSGTLIWSDEFNGTAVDTTRWGRLHSTYGSGGGQMQVHTPNNISVSGGTLKITAKKEAVTSPKGEVREYSSGFLSSRDASTPRYYPLEGKYEIRARIPHGQGIGSAFWLRHRGGAGEAEVDIMEVFHAQAPGTVTQTLHFPNSIGAHAAKKGTFIETPVKGTGGWHTYAVDIRLVKPGDFSQVRFRFYVDGVMTKEYINTQASSWASVNPQATWDVAISVPVGGAYWGSPKSGLGYLSADMIGGTNPNKCSLTYQTPTSGPASCPTTKNGQPIWFSTFPATYEVDYMRVYA